jgi:hypothetical protein
MKHFAVCKMVPCQGAQTWIEKNACCDLMKAVAAKYI